MKRTFIAIRVEAGEKLVDGIGTMKNILRDEQVRWVDTGKMHITLAFLGDTSEMTIKEISDNLGKVCREFRKFDFTITGAGVFRNPDDPRVIWAGIGKADELTGLHKAVNEYLRSAGIPTEERDFKAHLTLGRVKWIKNRKSLEKVIAEFRNIEFQNVHVTSVVYYESILQQTGPLYIPLKTFALG